MPVLSGAQSRSELRRSVLRASLRRSRKTNLSDLLGRFKRPKSEATGFLFDFFSRPTRRYVMNRTAQLAATLRDDKPGPAIPTII